MLSAEVIDTLALELDRAEQTRTQTRQFSLRYPEMDIEDAYAIQNVWVSMKAKAGARLIGHKVGLTSRAMQIAANITEPDYGVLFDTMYFDDGTSIDISRFIVPRIEVELAFILKQPLSGPYCDLFKVLNATDFVVPAIEIIDARIQRIDAQTQRTRTVLDTISDNAANAGVILGGRAIRPMRMDIRKISAVLYQNTVIEASGVAAAVLNHPAKAVAWLANRLYRYGVVLESGQLILSGSFTRPVDVHAGDHFYIDYDRLGGIACRFSARSKE